MAVSGHSSANVACVIFLNCVELPLLGFSRLKSRPRRKSVDACALFHFDNSAQSLLKHKPSNTRIQIFPLRKICCLLNHDTPHIKRGVLSPQNTSQ